MWKVVVVLVLLGLTASAAPEKLDYTEDLEKFKSDRHKERLELLVGSWLMAREHHPQANEMELLALVKTCLKHITRKDSVVKITSLIGKNMTATKTLEEVVPEGQLPSMLDVPMEITGDFDNYMLTMLSNYEKDLSEVKGGEGDEIKKRIDSEMEKRQKYYLGFIPANQFTHMMILVAVTVMMITCCTCFKYYNMRKVQTESKIKESREYFKKSTAFTKGKTAAAKATTNNSTKKNQ